MELSSAVLSAASLESSAVLSVPAELSPAVSSEDVPEDSSDASSEASSEAAYEDSSDEVELVEVLVDVLLDEEEELSVSLPQLARASAHADTAASSATTAKQARKIQTPRLRRRRGAPAPRAASAAGLSAAGGPAVSAGAEAAGGRR